MKPKLSKGPIRGFISNVDGEPVQIIYEGDKLKYTSADSIAAYQALAYEPKPDKIRMPYETFVKANTAELDALATELSDTEMLFLYKLQSYVAYKSCVLEYRNHKPLDLSDFESITKLSRTSVYRVITTLKDKMIIAVAETGGKRYYIMNPWIASRGTYINATLRSLFRKYKVRSKDNAAWGNMQ